MYLQKHGEREENRMNTDKIRNTAMVVTVLGILGLAGWFISGLISRSWTIAIAAVIAIPFVLIQLYLCQGFAFLIDVMSATRSSCEQMAGSSSIMKNAMMDALSQKAQEKNANRASEEN